MDGLQSKLVHGGEPKPRIGGAVVPPIFQSATFEQVPGSGYHDGRYIRLSNTPAHDHLHQKLALVCGTESALVASSGMAAITSTLLALLGSGDTVVAQDRLYGGTESFLSGEVQRWGIEVNKIDLCDPDSWTDPPEGARVLYCESITNPTCRIGDFQAATAWARKHGLISVIDATFATPVLFRPVDYGFDLEVHSATKALNGHGDVAAGVIAGRKDLVDQVKYCLDHLGGHLDANACFLLHRGIRTLQLRVDRQCENALEVARFLDGHPGVKVTHYPGLERHPDHHLCQQFFGGRGGGVLSFDVAAGAEEAERIATSTQLMATAPSLGGIETLIIRPASSSHAAVDPQVRVQMGVPDSLVRIACGVEDSSDLVADLARVMGDRN
ncbi:MAG: PLP-dependent transferase [Planctomycetota bacterium]|nr:PLP-dependent transferase [Planctomycetota bacterium]